jgi:small conductance mechanosensitive channel
MKNASKIACIALLAFCVAAPAQDEQTASDDGTMTDAERVLRTRKIIESDTSRLDELKGELEERASNFEQMSAEVTKREARVEELKEQLQTTTDPAAAALLQAEIEADIEKLDIVKSQAEIDLQIQKAVREQAETLEAKILIDQSALDVLLGEVPPPAAKAPDTPAATPSPTPKPSAPLVPIPGVMPPAPAAPDLTSPPDDVLSETAEQIEARKQAEKSAFEAEQAEQAVLTFLERKAALQEQIDLEKSLLETAEKTKDNVDDVVRIRQQELADAVAAGADKAAIREAQEKLASIMESLRVIIVEIDQREDILEGFRERMQALQEEQLRVTAEAERKREEAEQARKQSIWLQSPFHPKNMYRWAIERGPGMLAVIVVAAFALLILKLFVQRIARAMVGKGRREGRDSRTRADTLALSFGSAATAVVVIIGALLVFQEAGVDIATVLGGAAILGVAIAFGAQNLMRDYFNGFIILIEDQYELNDLVTIGNITGRVERVSLRTTALRDLQGKLHFIPNGEIKSVTNRSYEWAQIVFTVRVSYKESVDKVMDEMLSVVREMCAEPEYKDSIIDAPDMLGVDEFAEFGVIIKMLLRTAPKDLFRIKREALRRIKNRFDELGIEIPMPGAAAIVPG